MIQMGEIIIIDAKLRQPSATSGGPMAFATIENTEGGGEYRPAITSAALLYEIAIAEEDRVLGLISLDARGVH